MRTALGKLRVLVVVLALLLVGGVAAFVVYGRHLAHQWAVALPKRLADKLLQESFDVSFSHSEHGKTVFTVHAKKEQRWTSGLITLDDVGIELYGRQDGAADRIHGSKFEFDQAKSELRAVGDVYIDLAAPAGRDGKADESKTLHVKTSGLVFDQKTRTAETDAPIAFQAEGMTGTAIGARYDSERQLIVLGSAVRVSGLRNERPVVLTASHAEIDRKANVADLAGARYVSPGESVAADRARVLLTEGGEARGLEAHGHVELRGTERGMLTGNALTVTMTDGGKPRDGRLWGDVRYADRDEGRDVRGRAAELRVLFTAAGLPGHAVMTGGVEMESRSRTAERSVGADEVELALADGGKGRVAVREAEATGGAVLRMDGAGVKGRSSDEVRGNVLRAQFTGVGAGARVTRLDGTGHTVVEQKAANGTEDRSTGDVLEVEFAGTGKETEVAHAVQRGGFQTVRTVPAKAAVAGKVSAGPTMERGQAGQAVYDGAADRLVMSGTVQLAQAGDLLQADSVTLERGSGDAEATGNVRVSYAQAPERGRPAEPVYVLAARAVEHKQAGTADFFAAAGGDVRMWQGGSQVSAPELSMDKGKRTMFAHGASAGDADVVRTVLVSAAPPKPGAKSGGGAVRVLSHSMTYTEGSREVAFSGRVRVEDQDGVMTAQEATAYLAAKGAAKEATADAKAPAVAGFPAGQVERLVATGDVEIVQAERRASGQELVYTAADKTFVLTGSAAERPSMTDDAQGTITGRALRFRTGDKSVQVTGGEGEAGRVRSDLRVKAK